MSPLILLKLSLSQYIQILSLFLILFGTILSYANVIPFLKDVFSKRSSRSRNIDAGLEALSNFKQETIPHVDDRLKYEVSTLSKHDLGFEEIWGIIRDRYSKYKAADLNSIQILWRQNLPTIGIEPLGTTKIVAVELKEGHEYLLWGDDYLSKEKLTEWVEKNKISRYQTEGFYITIIGIVLGIISFFVSF